ncbi:hypothetical protein GZ359_000408 [Salmonella enterica]|nr:hypothetical protein [Salmonella enterica]
MSKADAKAALKPLIYPFENPSMTVGLAAINATEPPFKVEPAHLEAWYREGKIARYILIDELRETWNREGLGEVFNILYGAAKDGVLLASYRADQQWKRAGEQDFLTYGVYCIDTAEALYAETGITINDELTPPACSPDDSTDADKDSDCTDYLAYLLPVPEPVLPRYEARKIYAMLHGLDMPEAPATPVKEPKLRITTNLTTALISALKQLGFTDEDFGGEVPALQQKLTRKGLGDIAAHDKNTLVAWLKKANVR